MLGDEVFIEPVQELGLPLGVLILDIVIENGEIPHAHLIHGREFLFHSQLIRLNLRAIKMDVEPRRDCKDELDLLLLGLINQSLQLGHLIGRIRLPPLGPVIGIILGCIDIGVELMLMAELQHIQPVSLRPGCPIETFHNAPQGNGRRTKCRQVSTQRNRQQDRQPQQVFPFAL